MGEKIKDNLDKIENNRYGAGGAPNGFLDGMVDIQTDNYRTLLAMLLNYLTSTLLPNHKKKVPISISMLHELGNLLLLRPLPDKPSSFP